MSSIIIFGGSGVFGSQVVRELISRGNPVTIAGRKQTNVGEEHKDVPFIIADVTAPSSCLAALQGHSIAVHCAGPFLENETTLIEACLQAGCHYVDIADDRRYIARVRRFHDRFLEKGLAVVYGASSLPGISGALALKLAHEKKEFPRQIRVLLFIGNRNPKGEAAVESVFKILGKPIEAPQGVLRGMGDREWIDWPSPFGRRAAFNFESAEYDLFLEQFHASSVIVKVSFELKLSHLLFSLLGRLPQKISRLFKAPLQRIGNGMSRWGSSGGAIRVEFSYADGSQLSATLIANEKGQRMAILPAVLSIEEILKGGTGPGVHSAYEFLGGFQWLDRLNGSNLLTEGSLSGH